MGFLWHPLLRASRRGKREQLLAVGLGWEFPPVVRRSVLHAYPTRRSVRSPGVHLWLLFALALRLLFVLLVIFFVPTLETSGQGC